MFDLHFLIFDCVLNVNDFGMCCLCIYMILCFCDEFKLFYLMSFNFDVVGHV